METMALVESRRVEGSAFAKATAHPSSLRFDATSAYQNLRAETRKIRAHRIRTSFIVGNRVSESWQFPKESWIIAAKLRNPFFGTVGNVANRMKVGNVSADLHRRLPIMWMAVMSKE
jgi:hypothetical protein